MRTNGKCNNSHAPSTGPSGILLSIRAQLIPEGPDYEKIISFVTFNHYSWLSFFIFHMFKSIAEK